MSPNPSLGILFKEALLKFSDKHRNDQNVCGIKIDLRAQGIDLIVGIRFIEGESHFTFCTAGTNCDNASDSDFNLLSDSLKSLGVESQSGAAIMIKRNAQIVTTDEGCTAIESVAEAAKTSTENASKKRGGLFGLFAKK